MAVMAAQAGIQYAVTAVMSRTGSEYWIIRSSAQLRTRRMMTAVQDARRLCGAVLERTVDEKGETRMPEITVSMAEGRTDEQKAGMMRDITQALVKNLGVDAEAVVIQINEAPLRHKMKGGKTFVERAAAAKK
jgi:4-oxalocrotonate tautomerase